MMAKKTELYATSTIGAAGIIGMLLMMVFANGFSFSLGGDLSGQVTSAVGTQSDAFKAGFAQCLKDGGKYTEKQAVQTLDSVAMMKTLSSTTKTLSLITASAVGDSCTSTDPLEVPGATVTPVKGSSTVGLTTMIDVCKDKYTIKEFYCGTDGKIYDFPLICPKGTICKDATCVSDDAKAGTTTGQTGTTTGTSGQQTDQTASGAGTSGSVSGQQAGTTQQAGSQQVSEADKKKAEAEYKKEYELGYKDCLNKKAQEKDSDGDGLSDLTEKQLGTNPNAKDTDGDGLSDAKEVELKTNPNSKDSDGDGLSDAKEVELKTNPNSKDSDGDGLSDYDEVTSSLTKVSTNPTDADTDDDGVSDGDEVKAGTNPLEAEKLLIAVDTATDTDDDGLTDSEEATSGTDPTDNDTDDDGLDDGDEISKGTDPMVDDTDGDGASDGAESVLYGSDPNDTDSDDDGVSDGAEVTAGTDPVVADVPIDTDGDGFSDGDEETAGTDSLAAADYPACRDTDGDNTGMDTFTYDVKGTVTGPWLTDGIVKSYTDNCKSVGYVREAHCRSTDTAYYTTQKCPTGTTCSDGACI